MAFLYRMLPPRPTFSEDMSPSESEVMNRHVGYWENQLSDGDALAFGPVFDPDGVWGLAIIELDDEPAARAIAEGDPAVESGTCTYELVPMQVATAPG